jgi:hypothetical protein
VRNTPLIIGKTSKVRFTHPTERLSLYQFPVFDNNLSARRQIAKLIGDNDPFGNRGRDEFSGQNFYLLLPMTAAT